MNAYEIKLCQTALSCKKKNTKSVHGVFVMTVDKREWLAFCRKRNEFNVVKYLGDTNL